VKVLCIPKTSLGDFTVFWSAFRPWAEDIEAEITIVAQTNWIRLMPYLGIKKVIEYPIGLLHHGSTSSTDYLIPKINNESWEMSFDFIGSETSINLIRNVRSKNRFFFCPTVECGRECKNLSLNQWTALVNQIPMEGDRDAEVLKYFTGWDNQRSVKTPMFVQRRKIVNNNRVFLHFGASRPEKCMDLPWWAKVSDLLLDRKLDVIWNQGPSECSWGMTIPQNATMVRPYDVLNLLEVLESCSVYAGNDSGPMHVAANLGLPIFAVWVEADFKEWFPWETSSRNYFVDRTISPTEAAEKIFSLFL
jgi:ADP-heptose:LPS heptosyltransferase